MLGTSVFVFLFFCSFFIFLGGREDGGVLERERGKYVPDLSENCSHHFFRWEGGRVALLFPCTSIVDQPTRAF